MIRIVGVQRSSSPQQEFVLLQNQGNLRVTRRVHLVVSDRALATGMVGPEAHVFADEARILAGMYVLLSTGAGEPRWATTKDGAMLYYTYMHRAGSVWNACPGPIHLLATQHTFCQRAERELLQVG